jgi:hypothetical protein
VAGATKTRVETPAISWFEKRNIGGLRMEDGSIGKIAMAPGAGSR